MSTSPINRGGHAAFRLRIRAWIIDSVFLLIAFLIVGVTAGTIFENHPSLRTSAFLTTIVLVVGYEPFMVSRYGSTLGHRAMNIVVVDARPEGGFLPAPRAVVRVIVKSFFGVFSLAFMFITRRAQSLHDLAAGSEVRIRKPGTASQMDYFVPNARDLGVSPMRRITMILAYAFGVTFLVFVPTAILMSPQCLEINRCSVGDRQLLDLASIAWTIALVSTIVLGWTARLPGCRLKRLG